MFLNCFNRVQAMVDKAILNATWNTLTSCSRKRPTRIGEQYFYACSRMRKKNCGRRKSKGRKKTKKSKRQRRQTTVFPLH